MSKVSESENFQLYANKFSKFSTRDQQVKWSPLVISQLHSMHHSVDCPPPFTIRSKRPLCSSCNLPDSEFSRVVGALVVSIVSCSLSGFLKNNLGLCYSNILHIYVLAGRVCSLSEKCALSIQILQICADKLDAHPLG